jgi:hypothetical protein
MGVPTSEVGYTSATARRGDHEVHKGEVVALEKKYLYLRRYEFDTFYRLQEAFVIPRDFNIFSFILFQPTECFTF